MIKFPFISFSVLLSYDSRAHLVLYYVKKNVYRLVTGSEYTVLNGYSTLSYVPDFIFLSKFAQDLSSLYLRYQRNPACGLVLVYPEENIIYIFSKVGSTYLVPS